MQTVYKLLVVVLFFTTSWGSYGQLTSVGGLVVDTASQPLAFSTVVLLQPQDSVMYKFSITNKEGKFTMNKIKPGKYVLQISYMGYQNMAKLVNLEVGSFNDLGTLKLLSDAQMVNEVSIEADHIPILFKKDTIEYNADAFKTKENAVVEDLLKRLPGVEVERDGSIKAQGEKVEKLLVDGKEFFGDNVEIATKNLPAKGVDKVQVYDKLSELAEFTGVDDGERLKTINLEMKEDHKKGYFGNVTGGYGTDDRYKGKLNLNRFTDKMQLSVLGTANNINEQGFSFEDYIGFMGGLGNLISGGGGTLTLEMNDLPASLGMNPQKGLYTTQGGGANINIDLSKKSRLIGNYFYNHINHDLKSYRYQQNFLFDDSYSSMSDEDSKSDYGSHQVDLKLKQKFDTLQNMTLSVGLSSKQSDFEKSLFQQNKHVDGVINKVESSEDVLGADLNLNASLVYRRKFRKKGRSLVTNITFRQQQDSTNLYLNSVNDLMLIEGNAGSFSELLQQDQQQENKMQQIGAGVTYTEPIASRQYVKLSWKHRQDMNETVKDFYDIDNSGLSEFNDLMSNHYLSNYTYENADLTYQFSSKKQYLNVSLGAQYTLLDGKEESQTSANKTDYINFVPYARYEYRFSQSNRLSFSYSTGITAPSVRQLQPVVDNSNALSLYLGNPDLEPEYEQRANLHYMLHSSYAFTSLFTNLSFTHKGNKITNAVTLDSNLVQIVNPVNVEEDIMVNGYLSFNTPLKFIKSKINLKLNVGYNDGIVFLNGIKNNSSNWTKSVDLSLENRKKTVFDLRGGVKFNHNTSAYSSSTEYDNLYMNYDAYIDLSIDFLKTWQFNSNYDYRAYLDDDFATSDDYHLFNASISKTFLKHDKGELKLSVVDILNQNKGFNRVNQLNYILEETTNTLGRYFLLSFTYQISGYGS